LRGVLILLLVGSWVPPAAASSLALDRGPIVLGETGPVGVTVRVDEAGLEDRPLRLSVNVGSFGDIARLGPGLYHSVYTPPATKFPQMALVAVWRETGVNAPIDFLSIPLYGITSVPVHVQPGAEVRIAVGPDEFGPVLAGPRGKVVVRVKVPPGVHDATVSVRERGGAVSRRSVPIQVPPYNRLTAALVPHAVAADGQSPVRLDVYYDSEAASVPPGEIRVTPSRGQAVLERAEAKRFVYRYLPPAGCADAEIRFAVSVASDRVSKATAAVVLGLPPASRLVLKPPAQPLVADGKSSAPIRVLVLDEGGLGLPGATVEVTANGSKLPPAVYRGDGLYEVSYVAPVDYPPGGLVELAALALSGSGATLRATGRFQLQAGRRAKSIEAVFSQNPVPTDGKTKVALRLEVKDESGQPLKGLHLIVVAGHGVLGTLQDQGDGSYVASYVAPKSLPADAEVVRVLGPGQDGQEVESSVPVPLRAKPGQLLLGVRAAMTYSFADLFGPRIGLDSWVPIRIGSHYLGVGVSALFGTTTETVTDAASGLSSRSTADFVPLTLRVGYEFYAGRRLTLSMGLGGVATYARFSTSLTDEIQNGWGFGGQGFVSAGYGLGPGQAFLDLSYSYEPVQTSAFSSFSIDAGGLALELGYRFAVL
jgi:hypothetical protein